MSRRLAAEVRAVEEGHQARALVEDHRYRVASHERPGVDYTIDVTWAGVVTFRCDCPAGRHGTLCKHTQRVARRLERERKIELRGDDWVDVRVRRCDRDVDALLRRLTRQPADPFDGLTHEEEWL